MNDKLVKYIKSAEKLSKQEEPNMGAFENKWEWFVLRLDAEIRQDERQRLKKIVEGMKNRWKIKKTPFHTDENVSQMRFMQAVQHKTIDAIINSINTKE